MPKAGKVHSQDFLIENCHQKQDLAQSSKNQFFNSFLIEIWKGESCRQNQDLAKSWKNLFLNTSLIEILMIFS